MTIRISPASSTGNDTITVAATPCIVNSAPTNLATAVDQPGTKVKIFHPSQGNQDGKLTLYTKWHKWFGIDKKVYDNDTAGLYNAIYNAAPTNGAYYVLNLQMNDAANPTGAIPVEIDLTAYVRFYGLVAASLV